VNFYFCLYSNKKYQKPRKALSNLAKESKIFQEIFEYDRGWLEKTKFYGENSEILDPNSKGDGWCLWKPYVILESLKKIKKGEILIYMDSTDTFSFSIKNFLISHFQNSDILFCEMSESPNKNYTKRDTFHYMGCDSEEYWNSIQLEAGIIGIKKTKETIKIINEYLEYCKDPRIIKDTPNVSGKENLPGYVDHRYDQSILTNLKTKYSITASKSIRDHVECNIWESLHYWGDVNEFERKKRIMLTKSYPDTNFWVYNYLDKII
jgi:hypothetical protein